MKKKQRKNIHIKYKEVHLKIHPLAFKWVKMRAKKLGIGYGKVINEAILEEFGN